MAADRYRRAYAEGTHGPGLTGELAVDQTRAVGMRQSAGPQYLNSGRVGNWPCRSGPPVGLPPRLGH
jgi:hypothetical protein